MDVVLDMREGGDWSLDLCFAGLVLNLGARNVVDIPYKDKHRQWARHVRSGSPADWGLERRTLGHTPFNSDVLGAFEAAGKVTRVWLDERQESYNFFNSMPFLRNCPVVVVAGHDRFWNESPSHVAGLYGQRLCGMLLDNWHPDYEHLPFRTKRIGWSCNFDHYWPQPRHTRTNRIDICFVGYNSHPDRARFIDHVESKWGHLRNHIYLEMQPDTLENFMPKHVLFNIMAESRICLNLRGGAEGGKALRFYEIPFVGSFMLSQAVEDPGLEMDFRDRIECRYFDSEAHLDQLIDYHLNDPIGRKEADEMAAAGHARAIGPLSVKERWSDVLGWLDGK